MIEIAKITDQFTKLCLTYPKEPMPGMFNRFMHLLNKEQRTALAPYFPFLVRVAEAAREAESEVQNYILAEKMREE